LQRSVVRMDAKPSNPSAQTELHGRTLPGSTPSTALLAAIVNGADEAIFTKTLDGTITSWNPAAERLYGYRPDEIIGRSVGLLAPPDRQDEIAGFLAAVARGESITGFETERLARDGRLVQVSLRILPLRDDAGRVVGASTIARDVTAARDAEVERAWRADILDSLDEGVLVTDLNRVFIYANQALARIYGIPIEQLMGTTIPEIKDVSIDEDEASGIASRVDAGEVWRGDIEITNVAGEKLTLELTANTVDLGRRGRGRIAIVRDVTERRSLEAQIRQAQKMEAVGQLAGGVAHDFNNLLTAIRGFAEFARGRLMDDPVGLADMDEVLANSDRAALLVRQLLAFSRRQDLQPRVIEPFTIIEGIAPMMRRLIGEHIELATHVKRGVGLIRVDPNQLEQVVINLAINARDAMPRGGKLTIELDNVVLDEAYAQGHAEVVPGRYVLLAISDTGTGMDAETRRRIFEPFFTTKPAGEGTGMGLATAYGIVKQSGGSIFVYSEPGAGTTFRIYFPLVAAADATAPADLKPVGPDAVGTETILLVEDEPAVRNFGQRALAERGYLVLVAGSGAEAIATADAYHDRIDLLITDVVMPRMQGRELAARLTASRPGLRVLFVSGFTENSVTDHGVPAVGIQFLAKPFSSTRLNAAVRAVLDDRPA
jgi:two-component system cell cycle sensor histidine kinase/response regulator CckA